LFAVFLHLDDGWFGTLGIQSAEMLPSNESLKLMESIIRLQ